MNSLAVILVCLLEVTIVFSAGSNDEEVCSEEESPKLCPAEWTTFERPQGRWCVRIFYGNAITNDNAEASCGLYDARLTGLQNAQEKATIAELSRQLSNVLGVPQKEVSVRLGGARKPECLLNNACAANNTFMWTDKFTTGTDGLIFPVGQPDGGIGSIGAGIRGPQNCIHQMINWGGFEFGILDDIQCHELLKLYACGKTP